MTFSFDNERERGGFSLSAEVITRFEKNYDQIIEVHSDPGPGLIESVWLKDSIKRLVL